MGLEIIVFKKGASIGWAIDIPRSGIQSKVIEAVGGCGAAYY